VCRQDSIDRLQEIQSSCTKMDYFWCNGIISAPLEYLLMCDFWCNYMISRGHGTFLDSAAEFKEKVVLPYMYMCVYIFSAVYVYMCVYICLLYSKRRSFHRIMCGVLFIYVCYMTYLYA